MSVGSPETDICWRAILDALYLPELRCYLRYFDLSGAEPAVVFVPGISLTGTASFVATSVEANLAERRRIIIDLLGGGFSDRPDEYGYTVEDHADTVATLLDNLGLTGCAVVGHSFGGAVAVELASRRSDLVERLILAEASLDPGGGLFTRFVSSQSEADFVDRGYTDLLADLEGRAHDGDQTAAVALGRFGRAAPHALHRSSVSVTRNKQPTIRELLVQMTIPRIYIFGEKSLPNEDFDLLPSLGVAVGFVPEAGHAMTTENPEGFAQVIATFLQS